MKEISVITKVVLIISGDLARQSISFSVRREILKSFWLRIILVVFNQINFLAKVILAFCSTHYTKVSSLNSVWVITSCFVLT